MSAGMKGLDERLRETIAEGGPRTVRRGQHRNPDGPAAADRIANLEAENARLRADVSFLLLRSGKAGSVSFSDKRRWTGMSSNAIVSVAYGGKQDALPSDHSDFMSCLLCVRRLPRHRRTPEVAQALAKAKAAFRARYPRDRAALAAGEG